MTGSDVLPPVKSLTFNVRNPAISKAYFHYYFREVHGVLGLDLPQISRYVQFHCNEQTLAPFSRSIFDGHAECWFDDLNAYAGIAEDPRRANAWIDGLNMSDKSPFRHPNLVTTGQPVLGPGIAPGSSPGLVKGVLLVRKLHTWSAADFHRWWQEELADRIVSAVPGLVRYVPSLPIAEVYTERNPCYDGLVELWWDDARYLEADPDLQAFAQSLNGSPISIHDTVANVGQEVVMRWPGHEETRRSPERDRITGVGIPLHQWIADQQPRYDPGEHRGR
jgi:EthD domain